MCSFVGTNLFKEVIMDAYNRYLMRTSGEKRHQAHTPGEKAVFATLDVLREHAKFDTVLTGDEQAKSALVDQMVGDADRALSRGSGF